MKPIYIVLIAIGSIILFSFMGYYSVYSNAVSLQGNVDEKWGNVQSAYQRRADLIPGLINTVKGAAASEKEILTKVTNARAVIAGITDEIQNAKNPEQMEIAGKKINTAINLAFEAYPQIQSTKNFQVFQAQLEGTENRINRKRDLFNEAIKSYNTHIRGLFAGIFLNKEVFPRKKGFSAKAGAENAPEVKF